MPFRFRSAIFPPFGAVCDFDSKKGRREAQQPDSCMSYMSLLKTGILSKSAAASPDSTAVQIVRSGMERSGVHRDVLKPMRSQTKIASGCRR